VEAALDSPMRRILPLWLWTVVQATVAGATVHTLRAAAARAARAVRGLRRSEFAFVLPPREL